MLSRISLPGTWFTQSEVMSFGSRFLQPDFLKKYFEKETPISLLVLAVWEWWDVFHCWNATDAECFILSADWDISDSYLLGLHCLYFVICYNTFYLWEVHRFAIQSRGVEFIGYSCWIEFGLGKLKPVCEKCFNLVSVLSGDMFTIKAQNFELKSLWGPISYSEIW